MEQNKLLPVKMIVFSALFAALVCVGAYIAIPIGPVPIVLQNFFVLLAALLLGKKYGLLSIVVYLLCGIVGLPVFSKGGAGIAHLFGPTGGYLLSYLPAVFLAGFICERGARSMLNDAVAIIVASLLIYGIGVPWLKIQTGLSWNKAFFAGMFPFIIPDCIKIIAAVIIRKAVWPTWRTFILPLQKDVKNNKPEPEIP